MLTRIEPVPVCFFFQVLHSAERGQGAGHVRSGRLQHVRGQHQPQSSVLRPRAQYEQPRPRLLAARPRQEPQGARRLYG
jgi:hypothetical protein